MGMCRMYEETLDLTNETTKVFAFYTKLEWYFLVNFCILVYRAYSAAAILKKSLILGDTPTRGKTRCHICNLKQKNVYFPESVVVVK